MGRLPSFFCLFHTAKHWIWAAIVKYNNSQAQRTVLIDFDEFISINRCFKLNKFTTTTIVIMCVCKRVSHLKAHFQVTCSTYFQFVWFNQCISRRHLMRTIRSKSNHLRCWLDVKSIQFFVYFGFCKLYTNSTPSCTKQHFQVDSVCKVDI